MKSCFRSMPRLSLRKVERPSKMEPSGRTTSRPRTSSRVMPYRNTLMPPALVDTLPPMRQEPCAPNASGKNIPAASTLSLNSDRIQPASTTAEKSSASMLRIAVMRSRLMMTWDSGESGVAPSTRPVLPPCGTIDRSRARTAFTQADTSAVERGRSTATALLFTSSCQSLQ